MSFHAALFVLVLAPEAYLPLRALGANFHASADGLQAAEEIFELLEGAGRRSPSAAPVGQGHGHPYQRARGDLPGPPRSRRSTTPTSSWRRARRSPSTGPSGCGKSTVLTVILGLRGPMPAPSCSAASTWPTSTWTTGGATLAWVPQRPHLFARSVADNVRLGRPDATDAEVAAALDAAGPDDGRATSPPGRRHPAGRGRSGALRRRAPARGTGPRLRAATRRSFCSTSRRPASTAETEADVLGGGGAGSPGPHRAHRGPPPRARRPGRPRGPALPAPVVAA